MIPDRLPWRHRARPSATLHEIQAHSTIKLKSGLVATMLQNAADGVKGKLGAGRPLIFSRLVLSRLGLPHLPRFSEGGHHGPRRLIQWYTSAARGPACQLKQPSAKPSMLSKRGAASFVAVQRWGASDPMRSGKLVQTERLPRRAPRPSAPHGFGGWTIFAPTQSPLLAKDARNGAPGSSFSSHFVASDHSWSPRLSRDSRSSGRIQCCFTRSSTALL